MGKLSREFGRFIYTFNLGSAISGAFTTGAWINTKLVYPFTITAGGPFTAAANVVQILGANSDTAPSNSDNAHGQLNTGGFTLQGAYVETVPFQWIKVYVTGALASGSITSVDFVGVANVNNRA